MKISLHCRGGTLLLVSAALLLVGCASESTRLYRWGDYQPEVYAYFLGTESGPQAQIDSLEKGLQLAAAKAQALPPGYQAHLGLLYLNTGQANRARQAFETERAQFPESAPYMNFLLGKFAAEPPP
jgi:hypothetical protein